MPHRKRESFLRRAYLPILLTVSVVALLLPRSWTGALISLVQIVVPFQHAATLVGQWVDHTLETDQPAVTAERYQSLKEQNLALQNQVAALALRAADLKKQVKILTATRQWDIEGRRIGPLGRLIPARIVGEDILSWRASRLINAGGLQGVHRGAAVTSHRISIDRGRGEGVQDGMAVLLREALVGLVEQVGTHTARVRLLSDLSSGMKVRIGRFTKDEFIPLDPYFWLTGRGHGLMQIREVDRRDIEAGRIRIGDSVLADPMGGLVPAPMMIGKITHIDPDPREPLLSNLTVQSVFDVASLQRVYVFDPGSIATEE